MLHECGVRHHLIVDPWQSNCRQEVISQLYQPAAHSNCIGLVGTDETLLVIARLW